MGRVIEAFAQFLDGTGDPIINGWLEFLESGSNNTRKNTYNDSDLQIPNANPLQLDAEGRCPNVFGTGDYRVISYLNDPEDEASPGTQIQMFDPVSAQGTVSGGSGGGTTVGFETWNATTEYALGNIVTYNTKYYRSLVASNLNLNPAIETGSWEEIAYTEVWNDSVNYSLGDYTHYGSNLYISNINLNQNNRPDISPVEWRKVASGFYVQYTKTASYEVLPTELDSIFLLGTATAADSQFDLPVVDATYNGARVAVYNASNYSLTVNALGATVIWIDTGGTLGLKKGSYVEFTYLNSIDAWVPNGNNGPSLGGQILGTSTTPISEIYLTTLHTTTVPDDEFIYFGDGQDGSIKYQPGALFLNVDTGNSINFAINGATQWYISSIGQLTPGAGNSNPDIVLQDNATIFLGTSADAGMWFDATDLRIGTLLSGAIRLVTGGSTALLIDTSNNATISNDLVVSGGDIIVRSSAYLALRHIITYGQLANLVGNFYISTAVGDAMTIAQNRDIALSTNLSVAGNISAQNLTATSTVTYGALNDGSTTLQSTLSEIDQRCNNIPVSNYGLTVGPITVSTSFLTIASVSLGSINADSWAIVEFGTGLFTKTTSNGAGVIRLTKSGTATAQLGAPTTGTTPSEYTVSLTPGSTLSHWGRTCMLYVSATGTVTLTLTGAASTNGGTYANNFVKVTWIKRT